MDVVGDPGDFHHYTLSKAIVDVIQALQNDAADGTGTMNLVSYALNILGKISPELLNYVMSLQINLFGGLPTHKDVVPSSIFAGCFGILAFVHLAVFIINYTRGHYFFILLAWLFNCALLVIGFTLRATWALTIYNVRMALASEVLLVIHNIIIVSFDLILAQRLFTWRHPVGGSRRLFWGFMGAIYLFVSAVITITVLASVVPFCYYLSKGKYQAYKDIVMATSILVVLYSLTSIALVFLSYAFPPTAKDENLYTYQPWWVESFSPFYFVRKGAAQEAQETFMKRNHNHRHAIRVIAATHHHYNQVEGLTNQRGTLKHNVSLALIFVTTILIMVGSVSRAVVVFQARKLLNAGPATNNVLMYISWGLFPVIINGMYIVGRVDLRFYRPDRLPRKVREIITAEQSYCPSLVSIQESLERTEVGREFAKAPSEDHWNDVFSEKHVLDFPHKEYDKHEKDYDKEYEKDAESGWDPLPRETTEWAEPSESSDEFHF